MREICLVRMDKTRPALVLTREAARGAMTKVTVAPITGTIKGLSSEVAVGPGNGLDHHCVVSLDNVLTVPVGALGAHGRLSQSRTGEAAGASCRPGIRPRRAASRIAHGGMSVRQWMLDN